MGTNKSYDMGEPFAMIPRSLADGVIAGILSPEDFQIYVYLLLRRQPVVNRVVTNARRLGEDLGYKVALVGRILRRLKDVGLVAYNAQAGSRHAYSITVLDWSEEMLKTAREQLVTSSGLGPKSASADVPDGSEESAKTAREQLGSNSDDLVESPVGVQVDVAIETSVSNGLQQSSGEELTSSGLGLKSAPTDVFEGSEELTGRAQGEVDPENPVGGGVPAARNNHNLNLEENQQQKPAAAEDLIQDETTNPSELTREEKNRAVQDCDVTENELAQTDAKQPYRYGDPKYTDEYFAKRWEELPEDAPLYLRTATDELFQNWKTRQTAEVTAQETPIVQKAQTSSEANGNTEMKGREPKHVCGDKAETVAAVLSPSDGVNFPSQGK